MNANTIFHWHRRSSHSFLFTIAPSRSINYKNLKKNNTHTQTHQREHVRQCTMTEAADKMYRSKKKRNENVNKFQLNYTSQERMANATETLLSNWMQTKWARMRKGRMERERGLLVCMLLFFLFVMMLPSVWCERHKTHVAVVIRMKYGRFQFKIKIINIHREWCECRCACVLRCAVRSYHF